MNSVPIKPEKFYFKYAILISTVIGFISQLLSYYYNYNYAYRDSIFRMEAARRFFDNLNPGIINQIGTVWLPIPNLILMPFANIDYLWETGLAACIINFPAFVISSILIFLTIKKITQDVFVTWIGFIIFILNYNILYFQTTAMTEQLYLLFSFGSFYFLLLWSYDLKLKDLLLSSLFLSLAVGSRYDAWPLTITSIIVVSLVSYFKKGNTFKNIFIFGIIPLLIIGWWFLHNYIYYGDALEFSRGKFSTLYQLKYYEDAGRLLTKNNLFLSAKVYMYSVLLYSGNFYCVLALIGLLIFIFKNKFIPESLPLYLLWVALPVTFYLLYKGQIIIELPQSEPAGYFNSRYGLYLFPAIAVFSAVCIKSFNIFQNKKSFKYLLILGIIIQQLTFLYNFPYSIPSLAEAKYSYSKPSEDTSIFLKENYSGGRILYDNLIFALHPWTKIDLKDRITFHTNDLGEKAMTKPSEYVKWVLVYSESKTDRIYDAVKNNPDFLNNFELKYSNSGIQAFKLIEHN